LPDPSPYALPAKGKADLIHNVLFMFSSKPASVQHFPRALGRRASLELIQINPDAGPPCPYSRKGIEEHGWGKVKDGTKERRYPLPCPVCKTAMIGRKSDPELSHYDHFECLRCGAVVLSEESAPDDSSA
jgi:hypothetical protein